MDEIDMRIRAYRIVLSTAVVFSVISIVSIFVTLPMVYNFVHNVKRQVHGDVNFCKVGLQFQSKIFKSVQSLSALCLSEVGCIRSRVSTIPDDLFRSKLWSLTWRRKSPFCSFRGMIGVLLPKFFERQNIIILPNAMTQNFYFQGSARDIWSEVHSLKDVNPVHNRTIRDAYNQVRLYQHL